MAGESDETERGAGRANQPVEETSQGQDDTASVQTGGLTEALQNQIRQAIEPALTELRQPSAPAQDRPQEPQEHHEAAKGEAPGNEPSTSTAPQTEPPPAQPSRRGDASPQDQPKRTQPSQPNKQTHGRSTMTHDVNQEARNEARAGQLRMARSMKDAGSIYEALHAYEEILAQYPGTGVAAAATEDLVDMAQNLEAQGKFHAALDIFQRLEQYGVSR